MLSQRKHLKFGVLEEQVESLLSRDKFVTSAHRKHIFTLVFDSRSREKC